MRRFAHSFAATLLVAQAATLHAQTQAGAPADAPLDLNGKLETKLGLVKESGTILIPYANLRILVDGSVTARIQRGGGTASAKAVFTVAGLSKEFVNSLSRAAVEDLATKLRADGWTVLTWNDIKDDPDVVKMKRYKPNEDYGIRTEEMKGTDKNFLVAAGSDEQTIDPPMQGPTWGFRGIAKSRGATVLIPEFWFESPQLWGETRRGFGSSTAKMNADDGMTLSAAMVWAINQKGGWGSVRLKEYRLVADKVGEFVSTEDKSPRIANALSAGLAALGGGGNLNKKKTEYAFLADTTLYRAATMKAVGAMNAAIAGEAKKEKRK